MQTRKSPWPLLFRLSALSLALLSLLVTLLLLRQPALPAQAAPAYQAGDFFIIDVDTDNDSSSGAGGVCTLRDALNAVNVSAGAGPDSDGCFVFDNGNPTADTYIIFLPSNGYTYTLDPGLGELSLLNNTLIILGDTAANTIIQANAAPNTADFRVFGNYGASLELSNVTVRHGRCAGACNFTSASGGGILNGPNGSLTLDNSIINSNTASSFGGGIENGLSTTLQIINNSIISNNTAGIFGGGIDSAGVVTLSQSTVSNNTGREGGGIFASGAVTLSQSTVSSNTVIGSGITRGGGIVVSGGTLEATNNSTIANNRTLSPNSFGGGIYSSGGAVAVINSTVFSNTAGLGGGINQQVTSTLTISNSFIISNTSTQVGGGIFNVGSSGTVTVTNSTIASNLSTGNGGGIYMNNGKVALTNSIIKDNTATGGGGGIYNLGTATLANTTISGNTAFTTTITLGGGGIYNGSTGFLTVTSSRILTNTANGDGSGVFNNNNSAGATNITGSCIAGNSTVFLPAAFRNNQAAQQTAIGNWWGAATGPDTSGADTISGDVDTSGYLTASPFVECPTIGQGPASNAVYLPIIMTPPPGIIKGRITDAATGQPPQTLVFVFPYNAATGEQIFLEASPDDNGNYTLEVPPGSYKINFSGNDYVDQFYNNKPTVQTANIITVASGQTVSNINAALVPDPQ